MLKNAATFFISFNKNGNNEVLLDKDKCTQYEVFCKLNHYRPEVHRFGWQTKIRHGCQSSIIKFSLLLSLGFPSCPNIHLPFHRVCFLYSNNQVLLPKNDDPTIFFKILEIQFIIFLTYGPSSFLPKCQYLVMYNIQCEYQYGLLLETV